MSDFEVMPIGTAKRLAELEAERDALKQTIHDEIDASATMATLIERLIAERDALLADAERYRWLREKNGVAVDVIVFGTTHGDLDAAIDAVKGGGNG